MSRPSPVLLLAMLLALGAPGCDSEDPISISDVCVSYAPEATPTSGEVITRASASSSCELLELEFILTGEADVYGVGFTVVYNPNQLIFLDLTTAGSKLAEGAALITPAPAGPEGNKVFAVTRTGTSQGVDFDDDGDPADNLLVKLLFLRTGFAGTFPLTFEDTHVLVVPGQVPPPVDVPLPWRGGTVTVQ